MFSFSTYQYLIICVIAQHLCSCWLFHFIFYRKSYFCICAPSILFIFIILAAWCQLDGYWSWTTPLILIRLNIWWATIRHSLIFCRRITSFLWKILNCDQTICKALTFNYGFILFSSVSTIAENLCLKSWNIGPNLGFDTIFVAISIS